MENKKIYKEIGTTSSKQLIQKFGRVLSGMVMPNIGAFIAWGLIAALFIPTGWLPNERLATLVDPMIIYLLPLLIGYTGGGLVGKNGARGGVVGAIATAGVIVGTEIPMFLGAMIAGPLGGYCIRKFDDFFGAKIPVGFEMLANTFSAGIIGGILALACFAGIGPVVELCATALGNGIAYLVDIRLIPFTSIIMEPAKALFLNNAINHGVFTPLGAQQAQEMGRSIYFMIESNPGPGLGLLLAYWFLGKGTAKSSAPGAIVIHFFGGIHEIYFPYVSLCFDESYFDPCDDWRRLFRRVHLDSFRWGTYSARSARFYFCANDDDAKRSVSSQYSRYNDSLYG